VGFSSQRPDSDSQHNGVAISKWKWRIAGTLPAAHLPPPSAVDSRAELSSKFSGSSGNMQLSCIISGKVRSKSNSNQLKMIGVACQVQIAGTRKAE
jgi:hypothetical protein